ncbi:MAG: tRNA (adenosine(37)-N6)-threonylcarbamoyltransferase complex ATPase subunit type 1 TsaE [Planctomycetota bacterium]
MSVTIELLGLDATRDLSRRLSSVLTGGDVVAISGDLGAGKTTLVRELGRSLGVEDGIISSPTYVIANEYPTDRLEPALVTHIDAYRVGEEDELAAIGWDRLTASDRVVLIEWPERIAGAVTALGDRVARLLLEATGEKNRIATLTPGAGWTTRRGWGEIASLDGRVGAGSTTCPVTGELVTPDNPSWPFSSDRARLADLQGWFSEGYVISRDMNERDLEEGE